MVNFISVFPIFKSHTIHKLVHELQDSLSVLVWPMSFNLCHVLDRIQSLYISMYFIFEQIYPCITIISCIFSS
ncbi:hypothetical protein MtrunA17_Chr1g0198641 [Medicago truncatula]|uniref:Uncharacterized protein n=1 Tax=Medicago truncatula TaxID=3880 RepID=A0A396JYY4_MEDTR|nr:hypothetical protein MtrunA17_Chr1g0198641 [Medicago truncatula]